MGDGSAKDDGIYVLIKEVIDNSIDEHLMGHGKTIKIKVRDHMVEVRDYGRGIPLGKVIDCVSKINTGGKYDSEAFQKSVGLNGVGLKAVNALSTKFHIESYRMEKLNTLNLSMETIFWIIILRELNRRMVPISCLNLMSLFLKTTIIFLNISKTKYGIMHT